jgi:hypothetical protein
MVKTLEKKNSAWYHNSLTTFYGGKKDGTKIIDNGVPGPGAHNAERKFSVPTFLIKQR